MGKNRTTVQWLRINLFKTKSQSVISICLILILIYFFILIIDWSIINATFYGTSKKNCNTNGACWVFIRVHWEQLLFGSYPNDELWRIYLALSLLIAMGVIAKLKLTSFNTLLILTFIILPISEFFLIYGGIFNLKIIDTHLWGGLLLTLIIAISGIIFAFPIAILAALGRRSTMPVIKTIATAYIEFIRGVPLISLLFMASVMFPLFMPQGFHINKLLRALVAIILFQGAYLAEVIRAGLNAIPKGQYESSKALGFNYWPMMYCIILPQALRIVIPGIVNSQIALLKDTSLILIIGLFDFLGIAQALTTQGQWLGMNLEGYTFCAAIYWLLCFSMSQYSQRLEIRLNKDKKNYAQK